MKKTLLQINVCNNVFSTGKIASDIGELAIKNGWKSYIVSSKGNSYAPSKNTPLFVGSRINTYVHALETRLFDNTGLGMCSHHASKKLISYIKEIQPDIIHFHIIHGYYLNLQVLFEYLSKQDIAIVWTIHSCWEITGHCSFFDTVGCEKWKTGCHHCPQLSEYPSSWFKDRSERNYAQKKYLFTSLKDVTLVPVSYWLSSLLQQSFLNKYPINPIYNGIDVEKFKPSNNVDAIRSQYVVNNGFLAIAVASTWEKRKNLEDYVALSKLLPLGYKLLLIGLSDKQLDILPSGHIVGMKRTTCMQELVDLYTAADVVLNLSLEETFGLTTIEGFACGTPSIVYNCTASPELVSPETGFVVEPRNILRVIDCMIEIKKHGKAHYSNACRRRAEERFDKNKNFMKYIDVYREIIIRRGVNYRLSILDILHANSCPISNCGRAAA